MGPEREWEIVVGKGRWARIGNGRGKEGEVGPDRKWEG